MLVEAKVFLKHCHRMKEIKHVILDMLDRITNHPDELERLKEMNREVYFELSDGGSLLWIKSFPVDHFEVSRAADKATFYTPVFPMLKYLAH